MNSEAMTDAVVQAARGEPMSALEQRRLVEELQRNPELRAKLEAQQQLSDELRELKDAIRSLESPDDSASIFAKAASNPRPRPPRAVSRTISYAAASGLAAVLAAFVLVPALFEFGAADRGVEEPTVIEAAGDSDGYLDEFMPLSYYTGVSSMNAYSIVRVKIPLSSVNFVDAPSDDGWTIEADVLLGEDGLARGIRFAEAEIVLEDD